MHDGWTGALVMIKVDTSTVKVVYIVMIMMDTIRVKVVDIVMIRSWWIQP